MSQRDELLAQIKEKKVQLATAIKGAEGWKRGKSKSIGVPQASKSSTLALQNEIRVLSEQIKLIDNEKT